MGPRPPSKLGRVLVIAGSDSGGGAGIQADIKTITMLGAYAMTAVTAITAQDTKRVRAIQSLPPDLVAQQITVCLDDIGADTIKTGMLGSTKMVETIAASLREHARGIPCVIDPVMVATSGDTLVEPAAIAAIKAELVAIATLVTPNTAETELLTGIAVETPDDQRRAGHALLELGAQAALIKGGHMSGARITDTLVTPDAEYVFESTRLETTSTHGTGCTLASAIAAYLARGEPLASAVEKSRDYLYAAIQAAPPLGRGHGPVLHNWKVFDQQD